MAITDRFDHLQVVHGALVYALSFDQTALFFQFRFPPRQLLPDRLHRVVPGLLFHHVVGFWIDRQAHVLLLHGAKQGIDLRERIHFISKQLDAIGHVVVSRENLDDVATHAERTAAELSIPALIQNLDQLASYVFALDSLTFFQK